MGIEPSADIPGWARLRAGLGFTPSGFGQARFTQIGKPSDRCGYLTHFQIEERPLVRPELTEAGQFHQLTLVEDRPLFWATFESSLGDHDIGQLRRRGKRRMMGGAQGIVVVVDGFDNF